MACLCTVKVDPSCPAQEKSLNSKVQQCHVIIVSNPLWQNELCYYEGFIVFRILAKCQCWGPWLFERRNRTENSQYILKATYWNRVDWPRMGVHNQSQMKRKRKASWKNWIILLCIQARECKGCVIGLGTRLMVPCFIRKEKQHRKLKDRVMLFQKSAAGKFGPFYSFILKCIHLNWKANHAQNCGLHCFKFGTRVACEQAEQAIEDSLGSSYGWHIFLDRNVISLWNLPKGTMAHSFLLVLFFASVAHAAI